MYTQINDVVTPIIAFLKLRDFNPFFLLESVEKADNTGRFSIVGLEPVDVLQLEAGSRTEDRGAGYLDTLRRRLATLAAVKKPGLGFPLGLFGVSSFEMLHVFNGMADRNPVDRRYPLAVYIVPAYLIVFDHRFRTFSIVSTSGTGAEESTVQAILKALRAPLTFAPATGGFSEPQRNATEDQLRERVLTIQKHISAGEVFQTTLSARSSGETDIDPFQMYRAIRYRYPSPYLFYFRFNGTHLIGSSPESLVRTDGREVFFRPLTGISEREEDRSANRNTVEKLKNDAEELSKQQVFVDQNCDESAKLCRPDSIQISTLREIEKYSREIHLISEIRGELEPEHDQFDVFKTAFPAGAVIGSPKPNAGHIINTIEGEPRNLYGGSIGYFGADGSMNHANVIRSICIHDGTYTTRAGVVVTSRTNPDAAVKTILSKMSDTLRAFDLVKELL